MLATASTLRRARLPSHAPRDGSARLRRTGVAADTSSNPTLVGWHSCQCATRALSSHTRPPAAAAPSSFARRSSPSVRGPPSGSSASGGFDVTDLQTIERCVLTITHLKTIVPETPDGRARFQHRMSAALVQLWVLMTTPPSVPENDLAEADRVAVCECAIAVAAARGFFEHGLLFGSLLLAPPSPPPTNTPARVAAPAVDPSSSDDADRLGSASSIIIFGSTIDAILQCAVKSRANVIDGFTMALRMLDSMRTTTTTTTTTTTAATTPSRADSSASPPRIQSAHLFAPSESTLTSLVRLVLHTVQSHGDPALPPVAASSSAAVSWRARAELRFRVEWDRRVAGRSLEPEATLTFLRIFSLTESPVRLLERIVQVFEYTQDRWLDQEKKEEEQQQQQKEEEDEEEEKELVRPTDLGVGMDSVLFVCREICSMNSVADAAATAGGAAAAIASPSDVLARLTAECHRRDHLARALMHRRATRTRRSAAPKSSLASALAEAPTQVAHPLAAVVANQRKPARLDRQQQQQRRQQETDQLLLLMVSTPQLDTLLEQAREKLRPAPPSSPPPPSTAMTREQTNVVAVAAAPTVVTELPVQAPLPDVAVVSASEPATTKGATLEVASLAALSPVSADAPSTASAAAVSIATIVAAPSIVAVEVASSAEPTIAALASSAALVDSLPPTEPLPVMPIVAVKSTLTDATLSAGAAAGGLVSPAEPTLLDATSLASADPISPDASTTIGATSVPLATPLEAVSTAAPTAGAIVDSPPLPKLEVTRATVDDDAYARAADRAAAEDAVGLDDDAPAFPLMPPSSALSDLASSAEATFLAILARDYPLKDVGGPIDWSMLPPTASPARADPRVQARWKLLALRVKEFAQSWSLQFPSKPPPLSVMLAWAERVPTYRSAELILQLAEAHCKLSPASTPHAADLYHLVLRLSPSVVSAESILSRMEAHEFEPTALTYRLLGMIYARHRAYGKLEALAQYMEEHGAQLTTDDYESLLKQACGFADEAAAAAATAAAQATTTATAEKNRARVSTPSPVDPSSSTTAAQLVAFWVSHADAAPGVGWDSLSSDTQASVSRVMDDTKDRGEEEARVNVSSPGFQCCMLDDGDQLDASLFGQVKMILRGAFGRGRTCERFVQCQTAAAARAASRPSRPAQAQARDE